MRLIVTILILLFPTLGNAQLVTQGGNAAGLVQNVLLGNGVTVSNINYSGSGIAIGSFSGVNTNIGLNSGILMTTGTISNSGDGPHGPNNSQGAGMDNGAPGNGLLNGIAGAETFNAATLQFDFVPFSDTVRFNYVFASEEYLEYVQSGFNDAFGFFISGPGIAGQQNIARLPNGQTVAIDNIHSSGTNVNGLDFGAQNSQFYVNNNGGSTIQYDGFTKVLTAESKVQCGETYHLVIVIADAGDPAFDSGIFLEENSLESNTPVELTHSISQDLFNNPTIIAEDCVTATITLTRGQEGINLPLSYPLNISGTATELIDYSDLPNTINFPAGVSQIQFSFNAFQDGILEGPETIIMSIPVIDPCGNLQPLELILTIEDVNPVEVEITGVEIVCPGEEVILTASANGGGPPYTYLWSTGETTESITVSPSSTETFTVSVIDNCLNEEASDFDEVVVPIIPPLIVTVSNDITEICPYIPAIINGTASGGLPGYSLSWSSNFEENLGTSGDLNVIPRTTTTYTLTVTDFCGNTASNSVLYTITSPPLTIEMSPTVEICSGDSIEISVISQGGYGDHFYQWSPSGETTSSVWVSPGQTTSYSVSVSDECQTFTVEGQTQVVIVAPTADFRITSQTIFNNSPVQFQNLSEDAVTYEWYFGDGQESTIIHPLNTYSEPGTYIVTLIAIDDKGCIDSIQKPIRIEEEWYIFVPNTFTPDGNRLNTTFKASTIGISTLEVKVYNRWGQLVFTSNDRLFRWDATYKGELVPDGTYTYSINFQTNSGRQKDINGHVNVLK